MSPEATRFCLNLDAQLHAMLNELSDFHGMSMADTLRLCIRHEYRIFLQDRAEADAQRGQPAAPQGDDDVPW